MRTRILMLVIVVLSLGDFVLQGIVPSITRGKSDFTDPFVAGWIWRHGSNPYDVVQATISGRNLTGSSMRVVAIYPPTAYLMVSPLTFLQWKWANFVFTVLETLAACGTAACVVAISGRSLRESQAWIVFAAVLAFASFHTALHVANISVITAGLSALLIYLASRGKYFSAGVLLAVAAGLKPHVGIWLIAFYALKRKWRLVWAGSLSGILLLVIAVVRIGLPAKVLVSNYRANLHNWFRPGGENDFSLANPLRFELANLQVALDPWLGYSGAYILAFGLAALGIGLWIYAVHRNPKCSTALAVSSLLALTFLPIYHRVYDTAILTLALAWIFEPERIESDRKQKILKRISKVLFFLLMLPIQSVAVRAQSYLSQAELHSWWWNLVIAPYTSWILLAFSAVLLYALLISCRPEDPEAHPFEAATAG